MKSGFKGKSTKVGSHFKRKICWLIPTVHLPPKYRHLSWYFLYVVNYHIYKYIALLLQSASHLISLFFNIMLNWQLSAICFFWLVSIYLFAHCILLHTTSYWQACHWTYKMLSIISISSLKCFRANVTSMQNKSMYQNIIVFYSERGFYIY